VHDLLGQKLGAPLYKIWGLDPARTTRTSFTIAIDTPQVMAELARVAAARYPILKIKLGTPNDEPRLRAIRETVPPETLIRVDANTGWTAKEAIRNLNHLAQYDIEYVEQPVPAEDLDGLAEVTRNVPMPVIADESCITLKDVPRVVGRCDGINIKLAKCGGLRNALKMIHTARAHGMRVMVGCMLESSIGTTAMAHLTPLVDYADLDGHLLVADDPYVGVGVEHGKLILPDTPGLGTFTTTIPFWAAKLPGYLPPPSRPLSPHLVLLLIGALLYGLLALAANVKVPQLLLAAGIVRFATGDRTTVFYRAPLSSGVAILATTSNLFSVFRPR
jgi:L-alanine-DL-glutamate epimerase-like enolase superfamily enzyme